MKATLYLKHKFDAAHYLPNHAGKCRNMHGHTWTIEVWLEGRINSVTGMVVDFGKIRELLNVFDHSCINTSKMWGALQPATAENLAWYFLLYIHCAVRVRVWESDDAYAEVCAEDLSVDETGFNVRVNKLSHEDPIDPQFPERVRLKAVSQCTE